MTTVVENSIDLPNLYVSGFDIAWASNTTLTVSAGICRDSTNSMDISLGASNSNVLGYTVAAPLTLDFGVVGANGIDTGAIAASKVYAIYMIGDSRLYKNAACIATLASNDSPTMPDGWDAWRLIGYAVSDSASHLLLAYISGNGASRTFSFDAPIIALTAGADATYTAVALTKFVAPVDDTPVCLYSDFSANAAADVLNYQGYNSTGDAVSVIAPTAAGTAHTTSENVVLAQLNSAAPSIKYKVSAGTVNTYVKSFDFFL